MVPTLLSILENIHKLGPGEILKYDVNKRIKTVNTGIHILSFLKIRENPQGTYNNAKEEITYKIKTATKTRLISDAPIGAFLSGGIDGFKLSFFIKEND